MKENNNNTTNSVILISILSAILLAVGCFRLPIGYYTFLRITVFIAAIVLLVKMINDEIYWQAIIMALVAILFNPIIPVYLHSKAAWIVIDALTAIWFLMQPVLLHSREANNK